MASVTYDHVTKQFKGRDKAGAGVQAVNDLSIDVKDQEFLVLVGPSGCGKTTALRLLAGLEEITSGNIYIGERIVNDVAPKDRDIAMVFQSYALYPHMSVYDNMAFGLKLRKTPKQEIDRRVKEAADVLNIGHLVQRKPKELSGGQRQRVALGRAIVREPQVFLMDEPLSNLDAKLRVQTRAELIKLHRRLGTTFIYVTHDQIEAMTMGTRIAVMNQGQLQQLDTPQNLYDHPANMFVAGFIGSPSMNFLDATLVKQDSKLFVDGGAFRLEVPDVRKSALTPYAGKPVKFGIRPEDIHDRGFAPVGVATAPLKSKVDVTELMGNEIQVQMLVGGKPVTARLDPRTEARPGQDIDLALNLDNMHIFDPQTEKALV